MLHRSQPWHTAVLGAALMAYLLAVHLAETDASPAVLRPQVQVLAVGAGLLAWARARGCCPRPGRPGRSALLRLVAAGALIAAAALVLPHAARPAPRDLTRPSRCRRNPSHKVVKPGFHHTLVW